MMMSIRPCAMRLKRRRGIRSLTSGRADDAEEEDLADVLVDAMSNLDDGGLIWVLIPKPGRPNSVRVGDVEEAAEIAGLHATTSTALGQNWAGVRLTARPRSRR